ncbi:hypothetical protein J7E96_27120 [Streptomyces sp. ISL-96]|uniref:hypothetical protein n=1 Tax=Streptomyces sp. ISL-96 TaxID=2819191 RepID=UPI001BE6E377|nr:hypothetical protein [Streptomyces sp. ISL-96]MBT2492126.1 hypothetical protein [Streptomyces sp. ISL-96]
METQSINAEAKPEPEQEAQEQPIPGVTDAQRRALAEATQTYTDMVKALARAGIYMPELHIDMDERASDPQHMMILGWVSMGSARKLVRILEAARP